MTTKPIFSVGEQVILQSKNFPKYNGEYTVLEIISPSEYKSRYPGILTYDEWYYEITTETFELNFGYFTRASKESALRKKHQGSEFSFTELMNVLKLPQQVEN